jgi:hypothetical protein
MFEMLTGFLALIGGFLGGYVIGRFGAASSPVSGPAVVPIPAAAAIDVDEWGPNCMPRWCQTADLRMNKGIVQQRYVFQNFGGYIKGGEEWRDIPTTSQPGDERA